MSDLSNAVKLAIYRHFAETGDAPSQSEVAAATYRSLTDVADAYRILREQRALVLEPDESTIRMVAPFSGVPTQHRVEANGLMYYANCAWDALGIVATLKTEAVIRSRCEDSHQPLILHAGPAGPEQSDWLYHCLVPASKWWEDIAYT